MEKITKRKAIKIIKFVIHFEVIEDCKRIFRRKIRHYDHIIPVGLDGVLALWRDDNRAESARLFLCAAIGAGFCPSATAYMIKKIVAVARDRVEMSATGVSVNGVLLPHSRPLETDSEGRTLSPIKADISVLNERTVLLMSDYSSKSFDGRYFGLIERSQIIRAVRPVWTW